MAAIKRQLETNLGVTVNYYAVPFRNILADVAAPGASGIVRTGWAADYPSADDMLRPLLSTSAIGTTDPMASATGDNRGRYSNPRFDRLLDQAVATRNGPERTELYRQAERIAIGTDLALIPLWYRQENLLVNTDRFVNFRMDWYSNLDLSLISLK